MREAMESAPEILFCDVTYKLFKRNLALIILLVEDAHGASRIAGAGFLATQEADTLRFFFKTFREEHEEACQRTRSIMTDKDLNERSVIREFFPNIPMYLCLFHTCRTFTYEITKSHLGVTKNEKDKAVEQLRKLAVATSEADYQKTYQQFCETGSQSIVDYFNKNWHDIRTEWTTFNMINGNLGNMTNNRLESLNQKIKAEVKRGSKMIPFVHEFFRWFRFRDAELEFKEAQNILRGDCLITPTSPTLLEYKKLVTKYAYNYIEQQYNQKDCILLEDINHQKRECVARIVGERRILSISHCSCLIFRSMLLPCKHIFGFRERLNLALYDEKLCGKRWTQRLPQNSRRHQLVKADEHSESDQDSNVVITRAKKVMPKSVFDKRRLLRPELESLLDAASLWCGPRFEQCKENIHILGEMLRAGKQVCIHELNEHDESSKKRKTKELVNKENVELRVSDIIAPSSIKMIGRPSKCFATFVSFGKNKKK